MLFIVDYPSPVGTLELVAEPGALVAVLWPDEDAARVRFATAPAAADPSDQNPATEILTATASQLDEYFAGTRHAFDLSLAPVGTEFQRAVWWSLAEIPYGTTSTYGEQARQIGRPKAVRAVGAANGRNPLSIVLPCHRIVGANGKLTGFAGGLDTKRWLLDHEARHVDD